MPPSFQLNSLDLRFSFPKSNHRSACYITDLVSRLITTTSIAKSPLGNAHLHSEDTLFLLSCLGRVPIYTGKYFPQFFSVSPSKSLDNTLKLVTTEFFQIITYSLKRIFPSNSKLYTCRINGVFNQSIAINHRIAFRRELRITVTQPQQC